MSVTEFYLLLLAVALIGVLSGVLLCLWAQPRSTQNEAVLLKAYHAVLTPQGQKSLLEIARVFRDLSAEDQQRLHDLALRLDKRTIEIWERRS